MSGYSKEQRADCEARAQMRRAATVERDAKIVKCARDNPEMSQSQIARRFGCNQGVVSRALTEAGMVNRRAESDVVYSDERANFTRAKALIRSRR